MSWEQLMEHANEIQSKAVMHAVNHHETDPEYARNGVDGYYQNVPDLFRPFADMPDPARYQPMIDDLRTVLKGLSNGDNNGDPIDVKDTYLANPAMTKIATAGDYLDDWTGTAALAFKQKFLDPFPAVARNQFILVAVLKAGLEAHQSMWHSARADIDNVAHTTIDALDNTGGWSDKNQWNFTFTVLASVAAVATVPLDAATEGLTVPLTVTAIGAAAQVVATTPPSELPDKNSGGDGHSDHQLDEGRDGQNRQRNTHHRIEDRVGAHRDEPDGVGQQCLLRRSTAGAGEPPWQRGDRFRRPRRPRLGDRR